MSQPAVHPLTLCLPLLLGCVAARTVPVAPPPEAPAAEMSSPEALAPVLTGCPEGTHAFDFWSGEYPGPVVEVNAPVTVQARTDVCDAAPSIACTLAAGLYHPWSPMRAQLQFKTVASIYAYRATQAFRFDVYDGPIDVPVDAVVTVLAYLSEGVCLVSVDGREFDDHCPEENDPAGLILLPNPAKEYGEVSFFGAQCREGHTGWVRVEDELFARQEIQEGRVLGYEELMKVGQGEGDDD